MIKKFLVIFFLSISISQSAYALFLFNPYIGKSLGDYEESVNTGDLETTHFGMHLAWQDGFFTLGLDVSYMINEFETPFLGYNDDELKSWDYGLLIGMGTEKFRIWTSISLNSLEMENDIDGFYFGSGFRAGLGIKVAGDVFLNIEFVKNIYDESEVADGLTNDIQNNIKTESTMLSISVPTYF